MLGFWKDLVCMESCWLGDEQNPDPHISKLGPGMCIFEDLNPNTGSSCYEMEFLGP
jgi:hypothetical protein